ncbi:MAG TPA: cytochrome c, partial [Polyangiales bacterium]|nr:cytochrome c [Polyangiales bacterium]
MCGFNLLAVASATFAAPPAGTDGSQALRQVAGVLDYVAGDYRGAVDEHGAILDRGEYDEQLSLVRDADALAAQAGVAADAPLRKQLGALSAALVQKRAPPQVAELCRVLRVLLVERHHVVLAPSEPPSRKEAAKLYVEHGCPTCHGADGSANTEAARALDPRPANFLDPARVAAVSPHRAFFALSFGVSGTAMVAYPQLNEHQRWSLAFYVLSLRHAGNVSDAGAQALATIASGGPPRDAAGLAALTEEDVLAKLAQVPDPAARAAALAYLRAEAPFSAGAAAPKSSSMFAARAALQRGMSAYRRGDRAQARQELISAYLDGFEPHEAAIGARDRPLVREVERVMLTLRQAAANGEPLPRIEGLAKEADLLLSRAERAGEGESAAWIGAFTIALREGLEIALLVGALLGLVRRRGQASLVRYVHGGWMVAAVAGLVTWWSAGALLSGLQRELAEGLAALLAAVVLLGVTHWLLGQLTAKRFLGFLADRMAKAASSRRAAWGIFALSFV